MIVHFLAWHDSQAIGNTCSYFSVGKRVTRRFGQEWQKLSVMLTRGLALVAIRQLKKDTAVVTPTQSLLFNLPLPSARPLSTIAYVVKPKNGGDVHSVPTALAPPPPPRACYSINQTTETTQDNIPENGDAVRILIGAQQKRPAGVELEVPRRLALGVAVVHDAQVASLSTEGGFLDGEHCDAVVATVTDQYEADIVCLREGGGRCEDIPGSCFKWLRFIRSKTFVIISQQTVPPTKFCRPRTNKKPRVEKQNCNNKK